MSERSKSDDRQLKLQEHKNPEVPQTTEVVVDDSGALPIYANFCRVMATPEEVILDFGLNSQPFMTGPQLVTANQRIVMNVYTTKRLLSAIVTTIQRHEQTFGMIEMDVSRRVSSSRPQLESASLDRPAGQPDIIKLS